MRECDDSGLDSALPNAPLNFSRHNYDERHACLYDDAGRACHTTPLTTLSVSLTFFTHRTAHEACTDRPFFLGFHIGVSSVQAMAFSQSFTIDQAWERDWYQSGPPRTKAKRGSIRVLFWEAFACRGGGSLSK